MRQQFQAEDAGDGLGRVFSAGIGLGNVGKLLTGMLIWLALFHTGYAEGKKLKTTFVVKYVAADAVYLEGGSDAGLAPGQRLAIKREGANAGVGAGTTVAEIEIESVASVSAVAKIVTSHSDIVPGDVAYLSAEDAEKLELLKASKDARKYPQIISFTEGNPLDQEVRESLPKPPLPEVNRIRGRVGFEYGNLQQPGSGIGDSQFGFMLHADATRLGGTYWNLSGFYRGLYHSQGGGSQQSTLVDLINRTYHLGFYYDNPGSRWVAGVGRLYIPWASSLSTIDGFYLGRRYGRATVGLFGGSAPDPTSWSYNPHLEMGGGFVNLEGGSYDSFHFSSTSGIALTGISWRRDRQFGFFENEFSYKRYFSVYSDQEVDLLNGLQDTVNGSQITFQDTGQRGLALSRSYFTIRLQPLKILSLDVSENYFRNLPTFDTRLIGTGLLDQYLFQGLSGGFHLDLPFHLAVYSSIGRSGRTGDSKPSWDYLYGVTAGNILHTGVRADVRYSKFDSSFGGGTYRSVTLSRDLGEALRFDAEAGLQDFASQLAAQGRTRFLNGDVEWMLGRKYFIELGSTFYRGDSQDYNQVFITLGYRFDNRGKRIAAQNIH